jgi:hypothetical protein
MRTIQKGQYFYSYSTMYRCYRIYKADGECCPPRTHNGSIAYNEKDYDNKEDARKRVYELNGWTQ